MIKRTALFALAASTVLGLAIFSASDASARGGHGGGHGGGMGSHGGGARMVGGGHHGHRHHGHHHHRHHHHWRHWYPRRTFVYGGYSTYPIYRAAAPVTSTCTCLTKTYLPNGAVLFRDVCTNEAAVNPPQQAAEGQQQ
jgi:hypothetical protein